MPLLERDGLSIYYEVSGSGLPLVLGHGFLCSGDMWAPQLGPLAERYKVINIDLRGHGNSGLIDEAFDLYDLVDDILGVLDHLGIDRAVWAGLSIGGMVALRAAITAPDRVSGLILLATHAGSETAFNNIKYKAIASAARIVGTRPLMPQVARMLFSPYTRETKPQLVEEWKGRFSSVALVTILRTLTALCERDSIVRKLGQIVIPALVVVGEVDQRLPPAYSREITAGLPHARLVVIERSGHLPTLEQPEAVTSAMLSYLEEQEARIG
jgi:3-oxoadipate enol-lactonase